MTDSTTTLDLGVGGMTCASCVSRVERALKKVPGVQSAAVNLATESARVTFSGGEDMSAVLRRAVRDAGMQAVMDDPLCPKDMPFDGQRVIYGGFRVLVHA